MRTRAKRYSDYGFKPGEQERLKKYCQSVGFCDNSILLQAAMSANPVIKDDLYYTIVTGISYDKLNDVRKILLPKNDFYGYQRKCLDIFRNLLIQQGKWSSQQ